jgi:hypothetical protein
VDDRVRDAVELASLLDIVKNDLAELLAVEGLVWVEDFVAKVLFYLLPRGLLGLDNWNGLMG